MIAFKKRNGPTGRTILSKNSIWRMEFLKSLEENSELVLRKLGENT